MSKKRKEDSVKKGKYAVDFVVSCTMCDETEEGAQQAEKKDIRSNNDSVLKNSPDRIRTSNQPVNSRLLYR